MSEKSFKKRKTDGGSGGESDTSDFSKKKFGRDQITVAVLMSDMSMPELRQKAFDLGLQSFGIDKEELKQRLGHVWETQGLVKQASIKPDIAHWFTKKYLRQHDWDTSEVFKDEEGASEKEEDEADKGKRTAPDNPERFGENTHRLYPDEFSEAGGVPIFHPTMEQMRAVGSMSELIKAVHGWGADRGMVKIVPPKEWLDSLGAVEQYAKHEVDHCVLKRAVKQVFVGNSGVFRATLEPLPDISILEFGQTGMNAGNWTPHIEREHLYNPPAPTKQRGRKKEEEEFGKSDGQPEPLGQTGWDEMLALSGKFNEEGIVELERGYWRNLTYGTPLAATEQAGSLFPDSFDSTLNLSKTENMLAEKGVNAPGIEKPQLLFGMWKSTSPWQLEPMDLYSINYHHVGAPKHWYSVPAAHKSKFEKLLQTNFANDFKTCPGFIFHKTYVIAATWLKQNGVTAHKTVQRQGEFVITWPSAYHCGFNLGLNITESLSFGTQDWIPFGRRSGWCQCRGGLPAIEMDAVFGHDPEFAAKHAPPKAANTATKEKAPKARPTPKEPKEPREPKAPKQQPAAPTVASPAPTSPISVAIPTVEELTMYPINVIHLHLKNLGLYTNRLKDESKALRIANSQLLVLLADAVSKGYPQNIPASLLDPPHRAPQPPPLPPAENFRPTVPTMPAIPPNIAGMMVNGAGLMRTSGSPVSPHGAVAQHGVVQHGVVQHVGQVPMHGKPPAFGHSPPLSNSPPSQPPPHPAHPPPHTVHPAQHSAHSPLHTVHPAQHSAHPPPHPAYPAQHANMNHPAMAPPMSGQTGHSPQIGHPQAAAHQAHQTNRRTHSPQIAPSPNLPSPSLVPSSRESARMPTPGTDLAMESPNIDSPTLDSPQDVPMEDVTHHVHANTT